MPKKMLFSNIESLGESAIDITANKYDDMPKVINKVDIILIPEYLSSHFKKSNKTVVEIVDSMPKLDRQDYEFWESFFYHILCSNLLTSPTYTSNHSFFALTKTNITFDEFVRKMYNNISIIKREYGTFEHIRSEENLREILNLLYVVSSEQNYSIIEDINMSINADNGYEDLEKFLNIEVNNLGVIITLTRGFINLCLKSSMDTTLFFFERLFNCLIRHYGESIIKDNHTIERARNAYLNLLGVYF